MDVATTKAYIAPNDSTSQHTINSGTGAVKVQAGSKNASSAIADAGNIKFTPDAPTITADTNPGPLTAGTTYYYKLTALYKGDNSTNATSTPTLQPAPTTS